MPAGARVGWLRGARAMPLRAGFFAPLAGSSDTSAVSLVVAALAGSSEVWAVSFAVAALVLPLRRVDRAGLRPLAPVFDGGSGVSAPVFVGGLVMPRALRR